MIVLYVVLFMVILIIGYLFFAPFYLELNSVQGLLRFRFHRLASVTAAIRNNTPVLEMRIAGWRRKMDLGEIKNFANKKSYGRKQKIRQETVKKRRPIPWRKIRRVLYSFKVNVCDISIDTGNMSLNGILFPVLYLFRLYSKKDISINFLDENRIILQIENSLARMSWAYISS